MDWNRIRIAEFHDKIQTLQQPKDNSDFMITKHHL